MKTKSRAVPHSAENVMDMADWFMEMEMEKFRRLIEERSPAFTIRDKNGDMPIIELAMFADAKRQMTLLNNQWAKEQEINGVTVNQLLVESRHQEVRSAASALLRKDAGAK